MKKKLADIWQLPYRNYVKDHLEKKNKKKKLLRQTEDYYRKANWFQYKMYHHNIERISIPRDSLPAASSNLLASNLNGGQLVWLSLENYYKRDNG